MSLTTTQPRPASTGSSRPQAPNIKNLDRYRRHVSPEDRQADLAFVGILALVLIALWVMLTL